MCMKNTKKCIGIKYSANNLCIIHRIKTIGGDTQAYSVPGENATTIIYFDILELLEQALRIDKAQVKSVSPLGKSLNSTTENDCIKKCVDNQVCSVLTYKADTDDCFLYNFEDIPCKALSSDQSKCQTVEHNENSVTWFNPSVSSLQRVRR